MNRFTSAIFSVGLQEAGLVQGRLKDDKVNLMHVGVCTFRTSRIL